ncbi:hypothetical protein AYO38_11460 [bacterium SCGC AG-212-C10]|nr:hypothetical protein AYO38_11460 [bacterium SCGC AG-212-C10]
MSELMLECDGASLHVESEGDGPPVLVPSGAGTAFYRNSLSSALKERLQLVHVEMRGTGGSAGNLNGASFALFADDLERVRDALGFGKVFVLGHSNHGCIALEYGLRHGEHAAGIIAVGSVPDFREAFALGQSRFEAEASPERRGALEKGMAEFAAIPFGNEPNDELMLRRYISMTPLGWLDPAFDQRYLWGERAPRGMATYLGWMAGFAPTWNVAPRLNEIPAPVLAISGRYDYLCPVHLWEDAIKDGATIDLAVMEQSAHNPQVEERERFDETVLAFVDRYGSRL